MVMMLVIRLATFELCIAVCNGDGVRYRAPCGANIDGNGDADDGVGMLRC